MTPVHLYAIIPSPEPVDFDVRGIDEQQVSTVACGGHAVVLGGAPLADYHGLDRRQAVGYLLAHQCVVERVMRQYPVLPVKFGTVLPSAEKARDLSEQGSRLFRAALERLAGRVQMELVAFWRTSEVIAEVAQEPSVCELRSRLVRRPDEITEDDRVALGRLTHSLVEKRRAALSGEIAARVTAAASETVDNPLLDEAMVVNLALLADRVGRDRLASTLDELDKRYEGRLKFRCIGPLPPYSFASVEVRVPTFEAVDSARRLLALGETATGGEIKQAYHRLVGQVHPDLAPDDPEAERRTAELADACALLSAYVASVDSCAGGAASRGVFDRQTVDRTLMISVRRQEAQGWG